MKALTRAFLDHAVQHTVPADLPSLISELARLQAEALARLASSQRAEPTDCEILTTEKMVGRLGLPAWKIRELCRAKALPARKLGADWVISADELRAWAQGR